MTVLFKHLRGCPMAKLGTNERKTEKGQVVPKRVSWVRAGGRAFSLLLE